MVLDAEGVIDRRRLKRRLTAWRIAAVVLGLGEYINSDLLRAAGHTGFLLNLFNLLPIVPLDGGRAMAAIHPVLWIAGIAGLAWIAPGLILFAALGQSGAAALQRVDAYSSSNERQHTRV